MSQTRDKIMDSAEALIRKGGYGAFSFRLIAAELGIKSASVHYHFPTKDDLCEAVAKRYREQFLSYLGDPTADGSVHRFVGAFASAFESDGGVCLCGVLAGEAGRLEEGIRSELNEFAKDCRKWLATAFASESDHLPADPKDLAHVFFSTMEGAMAFSVAAKRDQIQEAAATLLGCWGISAETVS